MAVALACGSAVSAAVITAGTGGTHATLADAVAAAASSPGFDEIRLRPENFTGGVVLADQALTISGGWDAAFTTRAADPFATRIEGPIAGGRVLHLPSLSGAAVRLENLSLVNGDALGAPGGGLFAELLGGASLILATAALTDNLAAFGGGLFVVAHGAGNRVALEDGVFNRNHGEIYAAGVTLEAAAGATNTQFEVRRSTFQANTVDNDGGFSTGACPGLCLISLSGARQSRFTVLDTLIQNNRVRGAASFQDAGLQVSLHNAGDRAELRRLKVLENFPAVGSGGSLPQVRLQADAGASLVFGDSLVAKSTGSGIDAASAGGGMRLVNLTVADNKGAFGLRTSFLGGGAQTLANSIVSGNPAAIVALLPKAVVQTANLLAADPRFVARQQSNYRLKRNSPAINKGHNKPPGKLGPGDLDATARIKGGRVDQGAYESF